MIVYRPIQLYLNVLNGELRSPEVRGNLSVPVGFQLLFSEEAEKELTREELCKLAKLLYATVGSVSALSVHSIKTENKELFETGQALAMAIEANGVIKPMPQDLWEDLLRRSEKLKCAEYQFDLVEATEKALKDIECPEDRKIVEQVLEVYKALAEKAKKYCGAGFSRVLRVKVCEGLAPIIAESAPSAF